MDSSTAVVALSAGETPGGCIGRTIPKGLLDLVEHRQPSHVTSRNVWSSLEANDTRHFIEACVVDFKDGLYTHHAPREEWLFVVVRGLTRWVVFLCVARCI